MPNAFNGLGASGPYVPNYLQDEIQFRIDNDLRTIAIPADGVVLGVVGDKNVNHVNFQMPAWYNGFDMSTFQARINFIDAGGNANYYTVTDMTVMTPEGEEVEGTPGENDIIYFTWLVDSYATGYVGQVRFNVRLTKFTENTLSQAFNTQVNSCQVLEGIQLADEITQEQAEDLLFHMTAELQDITDSLKSDLEAKRDEMLDTIPDDYTALTTQVDNIETNVNTLTSVVTINEPNFINNINKSVGGNNVDNNTMFIFKKKIPKGSHINTVTLLTSEGYNTTHSKIYVVTVSGSNVTILHQCPINASGTTTVDYLVDYDAYIGICGSKSTKYSFDTTNVGDSMATVTVATLNDYADYTQGLVMMAKVDVDIPSIGNMYNKTEVNTMVTALDTKITSYASIAADHINTFNKTQSGYSTDNDSIYIFKKYIPAGTEIFSVDVIPSGSFNQTYSKVYLCTVNGSNVTVVNQYPITSSGHVEINYTATANTYVGICGSGATKYSLNVSSSDEPMATVSRTALNNFADTSGLVFIAKVSISAPLSSNVYTKSQVDEKLGSSALGQTIEVGEGKDYDNLALAVYTGVQTPNTTIVVYPGTYDFVSELATLDTQNTTGLGLYNNVHIKFMPGAKIVCNYTGPNEYINQEFSVFNANISKPNSSFTLEDVVIEAKNIRYCIHDEMNNSVDKYYKHVYKNCIMSLDNSQNPVWTATQCIGGGMGINGNIEVTNCIFNTVETDRDDVISLSWHNYSGSYSENKITVSNCRFDGTVSFMTHGSSTAKSLCIINNCSTESAIIVDKSDGNDNIDVIQYANEIRQ